jgi:hypothetical protein
MNPFYARLRHEALDICQRVAPELAAEQLLYICHFGELGLPGDTRVTGIAGSAGIHEVELRRRGLWSGHGLCIAVNLANIIRQTDHCRGARNRRCSIRDTFLATVLHEAAHLIDPTLNHAPPPAGQDKGLEASLLKHALATEFYAPDKADEGLIPVPRWFMHEACWIRNLCHILGRAQRLDDVSPFDLRIDDLADHETYGLTKLANYWHALGNEPWRMRRATFAEIAATPAPVPFVSLWLEDSTRVPSPSECLMRKGIKKSTKPPRPPLVA